MLYVPSSSAALDKKAHPYYKLISSVLNNVFALRSTKETQIKYSAPVRLVKIHHTTNKQHTPHHHHTTPKKKLRFKLYFNNDTQIVYCLFVVCRLFIVSIYICICAYSLHNICIVLCNVLCNLLCNVNLKIIQFYYAHYQSFSIFNVIILQINLVVKKVAVYLSNNYEQTLLNTYTI